MSLEYHAPIPTVLNSDRDKALTSSQNFVFYLLEPAFKARRAASHVRFFIESGYSTEGVDSDDSRTLSLICTKNERTTRATLEIRGKLT